MSTSISLVNVREKNSRIENKFTNIYHFSLSFIPAENVDDFNTSPISSRQKLKLLMVHM